MPEVYESFNKADGAILGPNHAWTKFTNMAAVTHRIKSNAVSGPDNNFDVAASRVDVQLDSGNHKASATLSGWGTAGTTDNTAGCMVRVNTTGTSLTDCYTFEVCGRGTYYIFKRVANVYTYYKSDVALPAGIGTTAGLLELTVNGSTISAYWRGVLVDTWTDTSIPAGTTKQAAGMFGYATRGFIYWDEFAAGVLATTIAATKAHLFQEDFDGPLPFPNDRWTSQSPGNFTLVDGRGRLKQEPLYAAVLTQRLDFLDSSLFVKIEPEFNVAGSREDFLRIELDSNHRADFLHSGTTLLARHFTANVQTNVGNTPYNPVTHAYRRVRMDATTTYFETSPTGQSTTWTQQWSIARSWSSRNLQCVLFAGFYGTETAGYAVFFDRMNISTATLAFTGAVTGSGKLIKQAPGRMLTGTLSALGTLGLKRVIPLTYAGVVSSAGVLRRTSSTVKTATVAMVGTYQKTGSKRMTGSTTATAPRVIMGFLRNLSSTLTPAGSFLVQPLGRILGRAGAAIMSFYAGVGEIRIRFRQGGS